MKLLYRGEKKYDEGLWDYLSRLGYWNGFSSVDILLRSLCHFSDGISSGITSKKKDMYKIRCILEQLLKRNISMDRIFNMQGCQVPNGSVKICQGCWEESRYVRYYWRFSHYVKCHIHGIFLIIPSKFSYHSDNVIGKISDGEVNHSEKYSINLLTLSTMFYLDSDNAIELMDKDLERHRCAKEIVEWVGKFFRDYMGVNLNIEGASRLIDSGNLIGFSVLKKMESIYRELLVNNESFEKSVRIIAAIRVGDRSNILRFCRYNVFGLGFSEWVKQEVLSVDELFYAYFGFGRLSGTPLKFAIRHEMTGFEKLDSFVDRKLCLAIFNSYISWPYVDDDDVRTYWVRMNHDYPKKSPSIKYNEFLATLGRKTIYSLE